MIKLTDKQKARIDFVSRYSGEVKLYRETSLSGKSVTLRYRRNFVEVGRFGPIARSRSGMILSVEIHEVRSSPSEYWKDDPKDLEKFDTLCKEAEGLFEKLRAESLSRK